MDYFAAAAAGAALATDACAVSAVCGASAEKHLGGAVGAAVCFGLFQALMPVLGWSIGVVGGRVITGFATAAAFGVLCFLGVKMIIDCLRPPAKVTVQDAKGMLLLAVATSIDAMAAGIALPGAVGAVSPWDMLASCCVIGLVTAALCFPAYIAGSRASRHFPAAARLMGGTALILLGIKTIYS